MLVCQKCVLLILKYLFRVRVLSVIVVLSFVLYIFYSVVLSRWLLQRSSEKSLVEDMFREYFEENFIRFVPESFDDFDYSNLNQNVPGSLQLGKKGPYRVLYNFIPATQKYSGNSSITYTTHATGDYLLVLIQLIKRWDGPVSVGVYAPGTDFEYSLRIIKHLRSCLKAIRDRVTFHLIFHVRHPPDFNFKNFTTQELGRCESEQLAVPASSYRIQNFLSYPVNVARNVARNSATTYYVLPSDIELMPSSNLVADFLRYISSGDPRIQNFDLKVYALPSFEVSSKSDIPQTKLELIHLYRNKQADYFHHQVCPHCQRYPGFRGWMQWSTRLKNIKSFRIVRRENMLCRWEPIYIGTKEQPLYEERLSWEGKQDKMGQMLEMCLQNYRFIILDKAFLVHLPGIKKRQPERKWRIPFIEQNDKIYQNLVKALVKKYHLNKKCLREKDLTVMHGEKSINATHL